MRCYIAIAALFAAEIAALPNAHADILYSFSSATPNMSWSFTEPTFITTDTTVAAASLTSVDPPAGCSIFDVSIGGPATVNFSVGTNFAALCNGNSGTGVGFNDGPINHLGTYSPNNPDIHATLVVSSTTVPEPSSLILVATGALGLLGPVRRKVLPHRK